jgi:hypothetical protein
LKCNSREEQRESSSPNEDWGDLRPVENSNIIELEIYSDEIKRVKLESDGSIWMYLGAIFLPMKAKTYYTDLLNNHRCIKNSDWHQERDLCPHPCDYHERNDTEIHYKDLDRTNARFRIAEKWIENILGKIPTGDDRKLYINILGLNLSNMDLELFGENKHRDMVIYNRFYRTMISSGLNYFLKEHKIIINKIYHDMGEQSSDKLFPWHSIHKIGITNERVLIRPRTIEFIDSDHRVSKKNESNFIQLLDLALGATFCCLHNPSDAEYKRKIGRAFRPILTKLLDRRKASDSGAWIGAYYKSKYYRTYQVSFFPRDSTELGNDIAQFDIQGEPKDDQPDKDVFYYHRPVILGSTIQEGLDKWC